MKSYKTELDLNNKQRTACLQHAGAARWAYNWGLRQKIAAYEAWVKCGKQGKCKTPTAVNLHRELNRLKQISREEGGVPWMYEVSKCAPQEALRNLDRAFSHFFRRCKQGVKEKGYPQRKSRHEGMGSFTLTGATHITDRAIQLPRIGVLRLKEQGYFPTDERIVAATVSERAGRWFVSIRTEAKPSRTGGTEVLGVDVGSCHLAVLSDGTIFENPKALHKSEKRLRLLQKSVSRKVKGSNNRKKAVYRLARQHYRVACIRSDTVHKIADAKPKRAVTLGIESLNVSGMLKNHRLSKAISDASLGEIHRQLEYKVAWAGGQIVKADRFYPSSKTCSRCKHVKKDFGLEPVFHCDVCVVW